MKFLVKLGYKTHFAGSVERETKRRCDANSEKEAVAIVKEKFDKKYGREMSYVKVNSVECFSI